MTQLHWSDDTAANGIQQVAKNKWENNKEGDEATGCSGLMASLFYAGSSATCKKKERDNLNITDKERKRKRKRVNEKAVRTGRQIE